MAWLLTDLFEKLKREDEVWLIEALGLTSEDIIQAFADRIEEKMDQLLKELED